MQRYEETVHPSFEALQSQAQEALSKIDVENLTGPEMYAKVLAQEANDKYRSSDKMKKDFQKQFEFNMSSCNEFIMAYIPERVQYYKLQAYKRMVSEAAPE